MALDFGSYVLKHGNKAADGTRPARDPLAAILGQVEALKARTLDLDKRLCEIRTIAGRIDMKQPGKIQVDDFYAAFSDIVWVSKDIAGAARIVAEDFRIQIIGLLKSSEVSTEGKIAEIDKWKQSVESKHDCAIKLPGQFDKLATDLKLRASDLKAIAKEKKKETENTYSAEDTSSSQLELQPNGKNGMFRKMAAAIQPRFRRDGQVVSVGVEISPSAPSPLITRSAKEGSSIFYSSWGNPEQDSSKISRMSFDMQKYVAPPDSTEPIIDHLPNPDSSKSADPSPAFLTSENIIHDHTVDVTRAVSSASITADPDAKYGKNRFNRMDRAQALFNKVLKLSGRMTDANKALSFLVSDLEAFGEFYKELSKQVAEIRTALDSGTDPRDRIASLDTALYQASQAFESYQKAV